MEVITTINYVISIVFLLCYAYQFFYIPAPIFIKTESRKEWILKISSAWGIILSTAYKKIPMQRIGIFFYKSLSISVFICSKTSSMVPVESIMAMLSRSLRSSKAIP